MPQSPRNPGPWIYNDPKGYRYLVEIVPMEQDPSLDAHLQPRAVVFRTEEGWIRVIPVGHDFTMENLTHAQIREMLRVASGPPG